MFVYVCLCRSVWPQVNVWAKIVSMDNLWTVYNGKGILFFFPALMWGQRSGMSMCTDCKALWGKFVICDIGQHKINWIELKVKNKLGIWTAFEPWALSFVQAAAFRRRSSASSSLERERERERRGEERERERESSKDRLGCDSGLLLLINSASYKMSTTWHTDRIQRVFNISCVEDIMISRLNLLCHSDSGISSPYSNYSTVWRFGVHSSKSTEATKKTFWMYFLFQSIVIVNP